MRRCYAFVPTARHARAPFGQCRSPATRSPAALHIAAERPERLLDLFSRPVVAIVVEAGQSAGTLFTAEVACRLGREVGVVPGRASDPCARGSNALLRDGAHVVLDAQDALGLVGARYDHMSSLKPTTEEVSGTRRLALR